MDNLIIGDLIDGSAIAYKKEDGILKKGLIFVNGETKWFGDLFLENFSCGRAVLEDRDSCSYVDEKGKYKKLPGAGYIDRKGEYVIKPIYYEANYFSEGLAFVSTEQQTFIIDLHGNIIKDFGELVASRKFNEGVARFAVLTDDKKFELDGFIDCKGNIIIPPKYIYPVLFERAEVDPDDILSCGLARVENHFGKYGYINKYDEVVIPFIYDFARQFENGFAAVGIDGNIGFINNKMEVVIPFEYESVSDFVGEFACADKNGYWGIIDKQNNIIIPFEYDLLSILNEEEIVFRENRKEGMMHFSRKIILPAEYDCITPRVEGILEFEIEGKRGVMDRNGNQLISDIQLKLDL